MQLPGLFHPLNEITFNPAARPGDPDWRVSPIRESAEHVSPKSSSPMMRGCLAYAPSILRTPSSDRYHLACTATGNLTCRLAATRSSLSIERSWDVQPEIDVERTRLSHILDLFVEDSCNDKQGTNQATRIRPETRARIGALAKYV